MSRLTVQNAFSLQVLNGLTGDTRFSGQMSQHHAFVMMVKEKYWIEYRRRHYEGKNIHTYVARGAAPPKRTRILLFYVSNPVKAVSGYADFVERKFDSPSELWQEYGHESVLESQKDFEEFIGTAKNVSFVRFKNLHEAADPIALSSLRMLLGDSRFSRKGFYVDKDTASKLVSLME
jgi:predicted transcriptional regulator